MQANQVKTAIAGVLNTYRSSVSIFINESLARAAASKGRLAVVLVDDGFYAVVKYAHAAKLETMGYAIAA